MPRNLKKNNFRLSKVITTSTTEKTDGLQALENAIEKVRETIEKLGGVFTVIMPVNIFSTSFQEK